MITRLLITIIGISISITSCYSQNIKKILSHDDLFKLETTDSLIKNISNPDNKFYSGFTGKLLIKKYNKRYRYSYIGTWQRKNSKYGTTAISVWDTLGRRILYKEFFNNGSDSFVCEYFNRSINKKYYSLENMTVYFENGSPAVKGHRCWRASRNKFGLYDFSRKRRYGDWQFFDDSQTLIKVKKYREIK